MTDEHDEHDEHDDLAAGRDESMTTSPSADALPEDLDVTAYVGPYRFPNLTRRRLAACLYAMVALGALVGWYFSHNIGLAAVAGVLLLIALYHLLAGWNLRIDEIDALARATQAVGFPIGHASAQLGWIGLRSRPVWRVLCYSADAPPSFRGLVQIDGVDGRLLGEYIEHNPEDWSSYGDEGSELQ